jgi:thymidine kinase
VGQLTFYYGTMNCGKSTLALQMHHNATRAGKQVLLFSRFDRAGAVISSRIGLEQPAITVEDDTDLHRVVVDTIRAGRGVDVLICDETQFYTPAQVEQLARIADDLDIDVRAFGLLSDFTTRLFPGSQRLLELADHREELQLESRCWCGSVGTHNARTLDGVIVRDGAQVVVGDIEPDGGPGEASQQHLLEQAIAYEVLCRRHHRAGITRRVADGAADATTSLR